MTGYFISAKVMVKFAKEHEAWGVRGRAVGSTPRLHPCQALGTCPWHSKYTRPHLWHVWKITHGAQSLIKIYLEQARKNSFGLKDNFHHFFHQVELNYMYNDFKYQLIKYVINQKAKNKRTLLFFSEKCICNSNVHIKSINFKKFRDVCGVSTC